MKNQQSNNSQGLEKLPVAHSIRKQIDAILGSETSQKALAELEQKQYTHRAELVARLKNVPLQFAAPRREAQQKTEAAAEALQAARNAVLRCNEEYQAAATQSYGLELKEVSATREIADELRSTADHRLRDYGFYLDCLREELMSRLTLSKLYRKNYVTGKREAVDITNLSELTSLRIILQKNIENTSAWMLEPLTKDEVTERLQALSLKLERPLGEFELKPPRVSKEEIEAPDVPLDKLRTHLMPSLILEKGQ